ncbi:MAG: DUF4347 domain-containing protein, partial [Thiohalobacterales bacterium]
ADALASSPDDSQSGILDLFESYVPPVERSNNTLVFIDAAVPDYEKLIQGLPGDTEVIVLEAGRDGVEQISEALADRENLTSISIVSHGDDGLLHLGNTLLSADNLDQYAEQLTAWGDALTEQADILIYGCDVANGESGQSFIEQLGELTGADIAASTDATGSTELGGDWELEASTGTIEAATIFTPAATAEYNYLLQTVYWTGGDGDWNDATNWSTGSVPTIYDDVVIDAGANAGTLSITIASGDFAYANNLQIAQDLNVAGTLNVAGNTIIDDGGQAIANAVDIVINGGAANFGDDVADSITVNADGNLVINSGALNPNNLVINSGGFLDINNGTLNLGATSSTVAAGAQLEWSGGTIAGAGKTLIVNSSATLDSANVKTLSAATLTFTDTTQWTGGEIVLENGATLENSGTFYIQTDADITAGAGGGSFDNYGLVEKLGSTDITGIFVPLNNFNGGAVPATLDVTTGTLKLSGGGLSQSGSSITANEGATVEFESDYTVDGELLNDGGTIRFTAGNTTVDKLDALGISSLTGNTEIDSGSVTVKSGGDLGNLTVNGGTLTLGDDSLDSFIIQSLTQIDGTISGFGLLTISGNAVWQGGTQSGRGVTNATTGVTFSGNTTRTLSDGRILALGADSILPANETLVVD